MYQDTLAFDHCDKYVVFNGVTDNWIESARTENAASDAVAVLNEHEQRNSRPCVYAYKKVTELQMDLHIKLIRMRK